jgi:hypothetical protein
MNVLFTLGLTLAICGLLLGVLAGFAVVKGIRRHGHDYPITPHHGGIHRAMKDFDAIDKRERSRLKRSRYAATQVAIWAAGLLLLTGLILMLRAA